MEGPGSTTSMEEGCRGETLKEQATENTLLWQEHREAPTCRAASPSRALGALWGLVPFRTLSRVEVKDKGPQELPVLGLGKERGAGSSERRPRLS